MYIENIVKFYRKKFIVILMEPLSRGELIDYLNAEKQRIREKYGEFSYDAAKAFIEEGCSERFHEEYFTETVHSSG